MKTVVSESVSRRAILKELCVPDKIPADYQFRGTIELFSRWTGASLGMWEVHIVPAPPTTGGNSSRARIFVIFAGRRIPVGRLAQAKAPARWWFILYRTGGVWSSFVGTTEECHIEISRRNATDDTGATMIHQVYTSKGEFMEAFSFLLAK